MTKKKAKAKTAPTKSALSAKAKDIVIGLGTPVVFASPDGPRAAIVHGFSDTGLGVSLTLFTDAGILVKRDVLQGNGEIGTWKPA